MTSTATKHTPGPWTVHNPVNWAMAQVAGKDGHSVAMLCANGKNAERGPANLALIAAAPDLLEALQKIIDMNVQYCIDRYGDASKAEDMSCVAVARAALAKATDQ